MTKLIHQTDLFHPHGDPDDHFDLAVLYALGEKKLLELDLIVMDYPPPHRVGDPAVIAVQQLDYLTGRQTPTVVGTPHRMKSRTDGQETAKPRELAAAERIAQLLREAKEPVYITVVGGSTDIALAGLRYPALFAEKCKAVLLNSGSGIRYEGEEEAAEYNVKLNASAYAALFDLPCPVYWFPCYHMVKPNWNELPGEYGTVYGFPQSRILEGLSAPLQNYFLYMLEKSNDPKYLRYLFENPEPELLRIHGQNRRRMWSTASFFFLCGLEVTKEGVLVPLGSEKEPLYRMEPVSVHCDDEGQTSWTPLDAPGEMPRYLFHILDHPRYEEAMTKALSSLLTSFSRSL